MNEQDRWLASEANHASADYDRDRSRQTWREAHPPSERAERRADKRTDQRVRNRDIKRFGKINWDAYQHEQLYDMIKRAEPGTMYAKASEWSNLAGRIEGTTGRVQQVVERLMGSWQGQAAVDAAAANTRLMQWAGTASHTAGRVAEGLATYTEAVETAQNRMPEPGFATAERNFRDGYTVTMTGGPSDAVFLRELLTDGMVSHEEARARKAEAVAVMETYESRSREVHDDLPRFTDAQTGIQPGESWSPPPAGPDAVPPSRGDSSPGTQPGLPPSSAASVGGIGGVGTTTAAGFADPSLPGGGGQSGGQSGGPGGGPGSLNGFGGAAGGGDSVRGGAGFGAGFGAGGAAGGGFGAGGLAGRGVPGAFAGPGVRGGMGGGAFGGMPMGAGANGEEDGEHTNKYDEGLDLFDDLPPAYPPVFGA
jgi:uncharacterized protein YukE